MEAPVPAIRAAIERMARSWQQQHGVVGVTVAWTLGAGEVHSCALGLADIENQVPAKPETVYRLASISKPITSIAVMQLVEQGKVDLETPVADIVRAWPDKRWPVTPRQLLCHQGGVRHYKVGDPRGSTRRYATVTDALHIFRNDPLLHEPGTKYRYTTYGYNLLGAVVESASGQSFSEYLEQHVFAKAGTQTLQDDDPRRIIPHRARGYVRTADGTLRNSRLVDISYKMPGGGLCSTPGDLVVLGRALMAGRLVSAEGLERMWTPQKLKGGKATSYGLGFSVRGEPGARRVGHSGAQSRVATGWALRPDGGRACVAVMCNLEGSPAMKLANGIADTLVAFHKTGRVGK